MARLQLLAIAAVLLLAGSACADKVKAKVDFKKMKAMGLVAYRESYKNIEDIEGAVKDTDPNSKYSGEYVLEVPKKGEEGKDKYFITKDDKSGLYYFVNLATEEAQWHDPRIPASQLSKPGDSIEFDLSEGADSKATKAPVEPAKPRSKTDSITIAVVAMIPILIFVGGTIGRIAYLQMYYPELLWPKKERKHRQRGNNGKVKPQKTRGKMNQDGKGGRSAN
ncbi:hypothetical protein HYH03_016161 [Edaphochlamys debaryana]|uniref:WW domain-containing protein n=1 Tax=Edaphochlamys debaryana TaxID=47281 RepID=A0A836BRP9_9CHLO|nr:hypothetical protein HYH03_016161 [Edaphochlamys debaryana]|eukprot:KAG2485064.1 hypothetical protein HYH03_016161 [Edaphochlamys debaryana]